jgi:anaerobic C4-dicarboxylate transporter
MINYIIFFVAVCMNRYLSQASCLEMLISIYLKMGLNPNGKIQCVQVEASGLLLLAERPTWIPCGLKL